MSSKAKKLNKETVAMKNIKVNSIINVEGVIAFDVLINGRRYILSNDEFKMRYTKDYACYIASLSRFK